jgi:hypothetical protein
MIKSQNRKPILFILFLICFISYSFHAFCNTTKEKLHVADSLFSEKKYTQSFELYEDIQNSDQKASSAMLLKMAFIKEGLGDITNALYYLNLYYLKTYQKKVLKKMENLADQNKLSGYNYDDVEFFLNIYHQYHLHIDLFILCLVFMFFGVLFYQKRTNRIKSNVPGIVYISLLLVLLFVNNYGREHTKALITTTNTHLMKGPSPGSDVIDVISKGHRVDILGKDDIWIKISWNDHEAYVKAINIRPIKL